MRLQFDKDEDMEIHISNISLKTNPKYCIKPEDSSQITYPKVQQYHKLTVKFSQDALESQQLDKKRSSKRRKRSSRPENDAPLYNIIRQQRKRSYVQTFIKKLKQSSVSHKSQVIQQLQKINQIKSKQSRYQGLQLPRPLQILYNILTILNGAILSIYATLSFVFEQVNGQTARAILIFGLIFLIIDMIIKFLVSRLYEGQKLQSLEQICLFYLKRDFALDLISVLILLSDITFNLGSAGFLRISYFFTLIHFSQKLQILEMRIITSVYYQQIWGLIKVFIFNFAFAHFLAILLIQMSKINQHHSWLSTLGKSQQAWSSIYIWAYYWGTTIMLTVGFGDISPRTTQQALCLIFIQTISCIVLAYNITCVGSIITKLRKVQVQKASNMKIFGQIQDKNAINKNLVQKVNNFIRQSSSIKQNYNIQEEDKFVHSLPESFKTELILQSNKPIFKELPFFKSLSQRMIVKIAKKLLKKIMHPEEFIYQKQQLLDIIILNNGSYSFCLNRPKNLIHGKQIQSFVVPQNQYTLLSLDFIFGKSLNYDVKSLDYAIVYKIDLEQLKQCLSFSPYDYQYFCMLKDKDRYLWNELQIVSCPVCPKQKHTMFKCPKMHFIPFAKHVIDKKIMWKKSNNTNKREAIEFLRPRNKYAVSVIKFRKYIQKNVIQYQKRFLNSSNLSKSMVVKSNAKFQYTPNTMRKTTENKTLKFLNQQEISYEQYVNLPSEQKFDISYVKQTAEFFKNRMNSLMHINKKIDVWNLDDFDSIYDFTFYFTSSNPKQLSKKIAQIRKKQMKQTRKTYKQIY